MAADTMIPKKLTELLKVSDQNEYTKDKFVSCATEEGMIQKEAQAVYRSWKSKARYNGINDKYWVVMCACFIKQCRYPENRGAHDVRDIVAAVAVVNIAGITQTRYEDILSCHKMPECAIKKIEGDLQRRLSRTHSLLEIFFVIEEVIAAYSTIWGKVCFEISNLKHTMTASLGIRQRVMISEAHVRIAIAMYFTDKGNAKMANKKRKSIADVQKENSKSRVNIAKELGIPIQIFESLVDLGHHKKHHIRGQWCSDTEFASMVVVFVERHGVALDILWILKTMVARQCPVDAMDCKLSACVASRIAQRIRCTLSMENDIHQVIHNIRDISKTTETCDSKRFFCSGQHVPLLSCAAITIFAIMIQLLGCNATLIRVAQAVISGAIQVLRWSIAVKSGAVLVTFVVALLMFGWVAALSAALLCSLWCSDC